MQAVLAHVVRERRQRQLLRDLRLADERARAAPTYEMTLAHELVERCTDRQARDSEVGAQLALRRDRLADRQALDEVEHLLARLALLRHRAASSGSGAGDSASAASAAKRFSPVSGSKKWKRSGSTATLSGAPGQALVRASRRAVNSECASGSSEASVGATSSRSAVTGGALTGNSACTSAPSSSTTLGSMASFGFPACGKAASSKHSGRIPSTTLFVRIFGLRAGIGTRNWPNTSMFPSTAASTRFIVGDPMNAATKRFRGRWYRLCGVSSWRIFPARMTATRRPRVIASTWSCVT